jgi:hypothetical protein
VEPLLSQSLTPPPVDHTGSAASRPLSMISTAKGHREPKDMSHYTARGHGTEALEQSVPSVLDAAAVLLAEDVDLSDVAVVTPASTSSIAGSLFSGRQGYAGSSRGASPINSRSPSPGGSSFAPASLSASVMSTASLSPSLNRTMSPVRPPLHTEATARPGPRSMSYNSTMTTASGEEQFYSPLGSPMENPMESPTGATPATATPASFFALPVIPSGPSKPSGMGFSASPPRSPLSTTYGTSTSGTGTSIPTSPVGIPAARPRPQSGLNPHAPPSPNRAAQRLSFMAYADLVQAVPSETHSMGSLTGTSASPGGLGSGVQVPPHLPSVEFGTGNSGHAAVLGTSLSSSMADIQSMEAMSVDAIQMQRGRSPAHGATTPGGTHSRSQRSSVLVSNPVAGEDSVWEREGLSMGLDARLEKLEGLVAPTGASGVTNGQNASAGGVGGRMTPIAGAA